MEQLAAFRLRILFRACFLLLSLAVVGMALAVLATEKQRSYDSYRAEFGKTRAQIAARLRHPAGQLALLNPPRRAEVRTEPPSAGLRPVVLPFSTIDFDDQNKVRLAVEMAGCLVQYPRSGSVCVAVGNNPWAGGFVYVAGTFLAPTLVPHRIGDEALDGAHRMRVGARIRGQDYRWIAPFEMVPATSYHHGEGLRGRFTGYAERSDGDYAGARPIREFRGWVWQEANCAEVAKFDPSDCPKLAFFSLRLPVAALRDALYESPSPQWPPTDLDRFRIHIEALPPGEGAPLFDSESPGATPPFSLADLADLLLPGESLVVRKARGSEEVARLSGREEPQAPSTAFLTRLVGGLPVATAPAPVTLSDEIATPLGNYAIELRGDARSVNRVLASTASRLSWFVFAMLLAIGFTWVVIELRIVRRIARLTRRATRLSKASGAPWEAGGVDLTDLRGRDELGILAGCLDDLLRRVKEDAQRERIRTRQEQDMWHAVGHEIISPLQSLLALHGSPEDPSGRYIARMQQAVRILYGSASPSEAFASSRLRDDVVDLTEFLRHVANNAGIADIDCHPGDTPVPVRADEYSLEDVFSHILKNADRYRIAGTPIGIALEVDERTARVTIHNRGPSIPDDMIGRIFEYGVSDQEDAGARGSRGQGLFVARTYMAKMGGTVEAINVDGGVAFALTLQRA